MAVTMIEVANAIRDIIREDGSIGHVSKDSIDKPIIFDQEDDEENSHSSE